MSRRSKFFPELFNRCTTIIVFGVVDEFCEFLHGKTPVVVSDSSERLPVINVEGE